MLVEIYIYTQLNIRMCLHAGRKAAPFVSSIILLTKLNLSFHSTPVLTAKDPLFRCADTATPKT